jgi:hypothetical protein
MFSIYLMVNYDKTVPKLHVSINILMKRITFLQKLGFKGEFGGVPVNDKRKTMDHIYKKIVVVQNKVSFFTEDLFENTFTLQLLIIYELNLNEIKSST